MAYFNPFRPSYMADPYSSLARLRSDEPVHYSDAVSAWIITSYRSGLEALQDYETFSSNPSRASSKVSESLAYVQQNSALGNVERLAQLDSFSHTRLRKIVARGFAPSILEKLRNDIRVEVSKQIDDMLTSHPDGVIEVVQSLAVKVPETILSLQLGLRADDRDQVMGDTFALMQTNFNDVTVAKRRAAREAKVRLTEFLESVSRDERVANDSVLASIARVEGMSADDGAENSPPSTEELLALVVDLAQAGSATTAEAIANGILAFATSDTAQSTLRKNSELLDSAVDEILRFDPPQQVLVRWVTSDLLFSGVQMKENDAVMVLVGGTNRDPDVFENPDIFDVERYQSNSPSGAPTSLAFGRGSHYCVGAPLARIALQEVFRSLLEKTSSFRLSDKMKAGNLSRTDDWFARGPTALEIAVTV